MTSKPCPRCRERGADKSGDNLIEFPNGHWHCFACSYHKFGNSEQRFKATDETLRTKKSHNLPNDLSRNIPTAAWKWLLKYGLPYSYWKDYVYFSEEHSRLIFKVGEPTDFYIGRYIESEGSMGEQSTSSDGNGLQPKRQQRKWHCYGDAHKAAHIIGNPETSESIVLVEDLISAHKVGQVNACIPLFGTNIFDSVISILRLYKKPPILWLDKDQNGNIIKKCNKLEILTGLPVRYLFTDVDPKELSLDNIKDTIGEQYGIQTLA